MAELMPGTRDVLIGEQILTLKAPVLYKLNQAWDVIDDDDFQQALSGLKLILLKPPPKEPAKQLGGGDVVELAVSAIEVPATMSAGIKFVENNFDYMVTVLRKGLMPLVTKKLALVIAIALDTRHNRGEVGGDGEALSPADFRSWVIEEITMPQAVYVLEALRDLSGWSDVGKALWKLLAGSFQKTKPAELEGSATSASPS